MKVSAHYTDGLTATSQAIEVDLTPLGIILPFGEPWAYADLELIDSDKTTGRLLYENRQIKGPGLTLKFEHGMADPARDYLGRIGKSLTGDSHWHFVRWQVITGLAIVGLGIIFYLLYPYANRALVATIPDKWAIKAGDLVLDELYSEYSANACHSEAGDMALDKMVTALQMDGLPYALRVQVVEHGQVNALTAPGGRIVILNGLLQQADTSGELAGVLAHEVGHVYYKHPMQGLVNILGFSIVGSFFGGDAASIAVVALSLSFSRDMERAADQKALENLSGKNISAGGLLAFFERLKEKKKDTAFADLEKLLSTHPLSEERIDMIKAHIADNERGKDMPPILSDTEWQALKDICKSPDED